MTRASSGPGAVAKRRTPGSPLSRDAFTAAALAFIDEHGADALTLRALGEAMGVHYTAVYRHFRGKDELVEAALQRMLLDSDVRISTEGTPRERLLDLLRRLRSAFAEHPGMALPNLTAQDEQATAPFVRSALEILEEMGLSGRDLAVAYQMLESFHVGVTAYDFADYPAGLEKRRCGRRLVGHPAMDEVSRSLDDMQALNDEAFETGANALLDACEAMAARSAG